MVKILRGALKIFKHLRGCSEKIVGLGRGGSENLYTSKPTHGVIIQIGSFSSQEFNDQCNSAISSGLKI